MSVKRLRLGIVAGFASFGVDAIVSTFVFPLLLRHLGKTEAGIWMLFSSVGAMLSTLLTGLAPTVTRAVALVAGRAVSADFRQEEWSDLRHSVHRVYLWTSAVSLLAAIVLLFAYFRSVAVSNHLTFLAIGAGWCGYFVGWLMRAWVQQNFSILDGFGQVGLNRVVNTLAGLINLGLLLVLLPRNWGALAPVAAYATVSVVLYFVSVRLLRAKIPTEWFSSRATSESSITRRLAADSVRMFVLGMTSYVVSQSCTIFVERNFGAPMVAMFAPIARVTQLLGTAAMIPNGMIFPYLASAWGAGDKRRYRRLSLLAMAGAPVLYALPGAILFFFSPQILGRWLGAANFIGEPVTRCLIVYGFVYTLNSSVALPVLAARHRSFVRESVVNLVSVILLMPILGSYLGVIGYPLGMILGTLIPAAMVIWQSFAFFQKKSRQTDGAASTAT